MSQPDLVFLTEENREEVLKRIDPMIRAEKEKELELKIKEAQAPARLPVEGEAQ